MLPLDESSVALFVQEKLQENISPIKKTGLRWTFRCPVCGDSKKSIRRRRGNYYVNNNSYFCFNCDHSASGLWVVVSLLDKEIKDVKRDFFDWCKKNSIGQPSKTPTPKPPPKKKEISTIIPSNWTPIPSVIKPIIEMRKIFEAPNCPKKWKLYYNNNTKRLVIPWIDKEGKIEYWQERAISGNQDPKYLFPKETSKPVFGLDWIDLDYPWVFLFEGVFDCIWMKNGIAIGGKSLTNYQKSLLERILNTKVYFLDNQWADDTGRKESLKMAKESPQTKMFIWPKDIKSKDLNAVAMSDKEYWLIDKLTDVGFLTSRIMNGARAILELTMRKG